MKDQGRAFKLFNAVSATVAVFRNCHRYLFRGFTLAGQINNTRKTGYHNGRSIFTAVVYGILHQVDKFGDPVGVAFPAIFYTAAANQGLNVDRFQRFTAGAASAGRRSCSSARVR